MSERWERSNLGCLRDGLIARLSDALHDESNDRRSSAVDVVEALDAYLREFVKEDADTTPAESPPETETTLAVNPDKPDWKFVLDHLVFAPGVSETSPCVRGTRVTVSAIIDHIVDGVTWNDILRMHPELTEDDIRAALVYTVSEGT